MREENFDELRRAWKEGFRAASSHDYDELIDINNSNQRKTALENLAERYKRFAILGTAMILVSTCYLNAHIFPEPYNIILACGMMVYFAIAAMMDWWLYRGVKSIDIYRESVSEVSRRARYYRRRHLQFMAVLVPIMIALLVVMFTATISNRYMTAGLIAGALFGLVIGLFALTRFMDEYRSLTSE